MKLHLSGCVGLHHMMFGICAYIEEHYDLDKLKQIKTVSGSNYVGAALLSKYSTRSIWELWSKRLSALIKKYPISFLFKLYEMILCHSNDILKKYSKKQTRKHFILITYLFKLQKEWINNYSSLNDYRNCIIAGSFIPFISGITKIYYNFRNIKCIDGGLCNYNITNNSETNITSTDTLVINGRNFLSIITPIEYYKWMLYGLISTHDNHKIQFDTGYLYAQLFLKNELDKFLHPRTSKSKKILPITGKLDWNGKEFY